MADSPRWQPILRRDWPHLDGHIQTEVLVVGGGLTGVTTALMLAALGVRVVLVEKERLGSGASWGCIGLADTAQEAVFARIKRSAGTACANVYQRLIGESADGLWALIGQLGLRCGQTASAQGGALWPLMYLMGLAGAAVDAGCLIFEQTPVLRIVGHRAATLNGSVTASTIVLATGMPLGCTAPRPLMLCEQHVFAMVQLGGDAPDVPTTDCPNCLTLRHLPSGMLARCDLGRSGGWLEKQRAALSRDLRAHFPRMNIVETAFRQEVMSRDGLPVIGAISPRQNHLLMATGYSGFGLTGSFLAGRLLAGHILARPLPEAALFKPQRGYPGRVLTYAEGALHTARTSLTALGRMRAPVCPHLGCRLRYNRVTDCWECPCHGSSFGQTGALICAPASQDAHIPPHSRF